MGLLDGKQGIIYGVRNERSLGWGCAQSLAREGARLAFSVYSEREEKDVQKLVGTLSADKKHLIRRCNLTSDEDITALHEDLKAQFGRLDFVIHAVAFSPKEGVSGRSWTSTGLGSRSRWTARRTALWRRRRRRSRC